MKCIGLSLVFLAVAQLSTALVVPEAHGLLARQNKKFGGNGGNNRVKGGNNGQNNGNQNGGNNSTTNANNNQNGGNNSTTNANNSTTNANNSTTNANNNQNGGGNTGNPQTSLTLDPSVIQNINGAANGTGEANSLVSNNNFINFCVGKTITNGLQVQGGSCNPTPMGDIPSVNNMPSCKFQFPPNGGNVNANTAFTVVLNTQGMQTGAFTDAETTYFAAPQQLNSGGQIIGHNHVVIESIASLGSTQPTNPRVFAFFKGLNSVATNGQLTADVTNGLPAGTYRLSSITTAANHQGVLVPVAQRGSVDDAVYFTVGGSTSTTTTTSGSNNNNNTTTSGGSNNNNTTTSGGSNNNNTTTSGGSNNNSTTTNGGGNNNGNNTTTPSGGNNNGNNGQNPSKNGKTGNGNQNPVNQKGGKNGRRYERRFFSWD